MITFTDPLTDEEQAAIETTREVLALESFDDALARIKNLQPVQWERQQERNRLWDENVDDTEAIKRVGSIEFFPGNSVLTGLRNRSRTMFGLPALAGDATDADASFASQPIISTGCWF